MIAIILCSVCSETIGTIEKDTITDDDKQLYALGVTCSNGHSQGTQPDAIELVQSDGA